MTDLMIKEKDYFFNIVYRSKPILNLDGLIEEKASERGGVVSGSGYDLKKGERDITVEFGDMMSANKFRADVLTDPELIKESNDLKVEVSDIDQYSRIDFLLKEVGEN